MELKLTLDQSQFDEIAAKAADQAFQKLMSQTLGQVMASPIPLIGALWKEQGGYLGAILPDAASGRNRAIIVADKEHEFTATFGPTNVSLDTSDMDGATNTKLMVESSHTFPAAEKCAALTINGFSDWFLGARREMRALQAASKELFDLDPWYWTSTQSSAYGAYVQDFSDGIQFYDDKYYERPVRPVRSFLI